MNFFKTILFLFSATFSLNGEVWTDCSRAFIDNPIADKALKQGNEGVKAAVNTATKAGKSAAGVGLAAEHAAIKNLSFAQSLGRNLRAAALTTGLTTAISGGKFEK